MKAETKDAPVLPPYRALALGMPPRMTASVNAGHFNADINLQYETGFLKITAHFSFSFIVFFFLSARLIFPVQPWTSCREVPPRPTLRTQGSGASKDS